MKKILTALLLLCLLFSFSILSVAESQNREQLRRLLGESYDASLYTAESYKEYQQALNHALGIYENSLSSEDEILSAVLSLQDARDRLSLLDSAESLPQCVESIDEILNNMKESVSTETHQELLNMKAQILTMIESGTATREEIENTIFSCNTLLILARKELDDLREYSDYGSNEGIVVPTDYVAPNNKIGNVTKIRLVLFWIGLALTILGSITVVIYFIKVRKQ